MVPQMQVAGYINTARRRSCSTLFGGYECVSEEGRPVRLRAYQAGLWGCLTNPGRVGGLVGSAYDDRSCCSSSYQTWITRNPAARRQTLLVGRSPYWPITGRLLRPLVRFASDLEHRVGHPCGLLLSSCRLPPRVGDGTDRIPELNLVLIHNHLVVSRSRIKNTRLYRSVKEIDTP